MDERTQSPMQSISVSDLGLDEQVGQRSEETTDSQELPAELLREDEEIFDAVKHVIVSGFAGAILVGPPGTSKSWYASQIAKRLTDSDSSRVRSVQFHASFQYEDFIEGFVPNASGGFEHRPKHFRLICEAAANRPDKLHILVIDEISRCDAARVFGEALTYIEVSKRGQSFYLASGAEMIVPLNVFILATMNPWDRGVDDMDIALGRRFAHIEMLPRSDLLALLLEKANLSEVQEQGILNFFEQLQKHPNPMCHIGHAYFVNISDAESVSRLWQFQLKHVLSRVLRDDPEEMRRIETLWRQMVEQPLQALPASEITASETKSE